MAASWVRVFASDPIPDSLWSGALWFVEGIVGNRLYVGNLSFSITDDSLKQAFAAHGDVVSASVVMDRMTNRSRGFGFVEMATNEAAEKATQGMNGQLLDGRPITVNEARERAPRAPRSFDRGGGGGGGGYGGGGGGGGGYGGDRGGGGGYGDGGGGRGGRGGGGGRRDRDRSDRGGGGGGGRDRW